MYFILYLLRPFPPWTLMLDPFSHLLLVINSALNILFYGIFNKKFRDITRKEFVRCFPKTAARLSPSKSKRVIPSAKQIPNKGNQTANTRLPVTEITHMSSTRHNGEELVPLTTKTTELPVNSNQMRDPMSLMTRCVSDCKTSQNTIPTSVASSTISAANSNNKLLMDSSTQIPNSEYTTNLKRIPTKEKGNNRNNGAIGEAVLSKGNSIKSTSSISKKASVNEECMNIEACNKFDKTADIDGIKKFPNTPLQCNEKDGDNKNVPAKKVIIFIFRASKFAELFKVE